MNIFISGGGRVGFHLAKLLSEDSHDVTVIEQDADLIERIDYAVDARTVCGHAGDVLLLKGAGAGEAELFVAATGDDEINLVTASVAKGLGAKQVVARTHDPMYAESNILYETMMGIDYLISPEAITANEITTYIQNPGVVASETFARGHVHMTQMRAAVTPLSAGQTVKDLRLPNGVLLGMLSRNGDVEIPDGNSTIEQRDLVTLIGNKDSMDESKQLFLGEAAKIQKVVIMGGGSVGGYLAQVLEKQGFAVKLFDRSMARCHELASVLRKTKVVCRDATSRLTLEQEHVDGAHIFVAATGDDERNIMASVLAKEIGARETLAVVHQPDFASLVGKLGIDHAVTPRACLASRIVKLVNLHRSESSALLEEGQAEILEYKAHPGSSMLSKPLKAIDLPSNCLIAAIMRGDQVIIPGGDDEILANDSVIVITRTGNAKSIEQLFAV